MISVLFWILVFTKAYCGIVMIHLEQQDSSCKVSACMLLLVHVHQLKENKKIICNQQGTYRNIKTVVNT
jgi:hypothetical protein